MPTRASLPGIRGQRASKGRIHLVWVLPLVLVVLLGLLAVLLMPHGGLGGYRTWGNMPFSATTWKEADTRKPDSPRGAMVADLVREHELVGMTRSALEAMLGLPDDTRYANGGRKLSVQDATEWRYSLGVHSRWQMDMDVLTIRFDEHDRVKDWRISQG